MLKFKMCTKAGGCELSRMEREREIDGYERRAAWGCYPPLFAPLFSHAEVKMLRAGNTKARLTAGRDAG